MEEKELQSEENKLHTKRYWVVLGLVIAIILGGFFIFDALKYCTIL